ncbi:maleylpyruvate isomerase family mycothiol-dependent enzyme [Embleya scabrispora]|uniref:maleylpyruvate isomerase family mycothiol-dependent enzyme n=1 Tax=Embleya scabrispora TaxID=159449 RepID=UPI000360A13C|nr:maleylpyruvate isomerase family mycothiol-dependent enzyme [Embleya scabrispora]MYS80567.1 maleylpyruvate isomerase family mycothiol-dependent enzyme [Streptomyces sp. SID5474]
MTPDRPSRTVLTHWLSEGTGRLLDAVDALDDARLVGRSTLPGWTNAHLLTHVARNADALGNLLDWAVTGVESPMYPHGAIRRAADIEAGAARPPEAIRADVRAGATRLRDCLAAVPEAAWGREVRTAQGRLVRADRVPWLRVREVWIHVVDLGTGATFAELPGDLAQALLDDVVGTLAAKNAGCPALVLHDRTGGSVRTTRSPAPGEIVDHVEGSAAELLGWLTGRGDGAGLTHSATAPPTPPPWL